MADGPHAEIISRKLKKVYANQLYKNFTTSFPPPKVVFKYEADWDQVWVRLQSPVLGLMVRELLFMVIHNIMNNKDKMFKFNMTASPNCSSCKVVREAWFWLRQRFLAILPPEEKCKPAFSEDPLQYEIHQKSNKPPLGNIFGLFS